MNIKALWVPSPNFHAGRKVPVTAIVVHCTASKTAASAISWFQNPVSKVSAHFIIGENSEIYQLVKLENVAWHVHGHNEYTVGIEVVSDGSSEMTPGQSESLKGLIASLMAAYGLLTASVTCHRLIAPESLKSCPGRIFFGEPPETGLARWLKEVFGSEKKS